MTDLTKEQLYDLFVQDLDEYIRVTGDNPITRLTPTGDIAELLDTAQKMCKARLFTDDDVEIFPAICASTAALQIDRDELRGLLDESQRILRDSVTSTSELAELRKDRERLEWLIKGTEMYVKDAYMVAHHPEGWYVGNSPSMLPKSHKTFRAAIDAAMEATK